jgi:hypothetical protein
MIRKENWKGRDDEKDNKINDNDDYEIKHWMFKGKLRKWKK